MSFLFGLWSVLYFVCI